MRWPATLLIVLTLTVLLRIPTLFEPYWYGDEGIFAAVASQMNRGAKLYVETFDNKPPMIYLLYALPFALFGTNLLAVKALALLAVLAAQIFLYLTARKSFGQRVGVLAALLLGLSASIPTFEGNLALTELFMLPFTASAIFFILYKPTMYLWAGFFLSIAFLLKPIAGIEYTAIFFYVFCMKKSLLKQKLTLITGFIFLPLAFALYFVLNGTFSDFFFASILFYTGYLQWTPHAAQSATDLLIKVGVPTGVVLLLWIGKVRGLLPRTKQTSVSILTVLWLLSSWTATLFSGRPYSHYIVEALPATALAVGAFVWWVGRRAHLLALAVLVMLLLPLVQAARVFPVLNPGTLGLYHPLPYYRNFVDLVTGKIPAATYADRFDRTVNRNLALTSWLATYVSPNEYVYIWGDAPWVYALAPIRNPSRYVVAFHVLEIRPAREQMLAELARNPPRYIVVIKDFTEFRTLEQFVVEHYRQRATVADGIIWERQ